MSESCGENCSCGSGINLKRIIETKYFDNSMPRIEKIDVGDWIDLRVRNIIEVESERSVFNYNIKRFKYQSNTFMKVYLGIGMKLPNGFEAHIAPRGSMFKHTGLIQTNSPGVVDNSYCGDHDEWFIPCFSLKSGEVELHQRICQFRLFPTMNNFLPNLFFDVVNHLEYSSRGGHGSTGKK